jgi:uncharacterized repeat protein (TIGR03943 family)
MTKPAQNLLLVLLGGAALWITLATDEYLNYVNPWFRLLLAAAGAVLITLGGVGLFRGYAERRRPGEITRPDGHGDHHGRGPRVAWLLLLPAVVIFVIAPPPLGSFTAGRPGAQPAPPPPSAASGQGFAPIRGTGPAEMPIGEFVGRAWQEHYGGNPTGLPGRTVKLVGFVIRPVKGGPDAGGGWFLTRMRIACCAADGVPIQVIVRGRPAPPADTWVRVTGTWLAAPKPTAEQPLQQLTAADVQRIPKPRKPYE